MSVRVPFADDTGPRIPVSIITGFLGSGKTTLLNNLLRAPEMANAAVIINEFGDVPLDQYFVDLPSDDVAVLPNGCLCCIARDGLEEALTRLLNMPRPGRGPLARIVIETSGLADPAPIAQLVLDTPSSAGRLMLDQVIATVDAEHLFEQLGRHSECPKQIALADRLVFTKADRIDATVIASARELTLQYNEHAEHLLGRQGGVTSALPMAARAVDGGHSLCGERGSRRPRGSGAVHGGCDHSARITAVSIVDDEPVEWAAFSRWFRNLRRLNGESLLRVKGVLSVAGEPSPVAIDAIHHIAYPPRRLPASAELAGTSRLVFITQGIPGEEIQAAWAKFRSENRREIETA